MEAGGMVETGSPRRQGSLSSLHRLSSGSFSHNKSLTPSSGNFQTSASHQLANQTSPSSMSLHQSNMCKDLDKFTRQFILKSIQVIVQSRIAANKKLKTECKPSGNDWFNINILDHPEISERTKTAIDMSAGPTAATTAGTNTRLSVRSNWQVCCEISLKANEIEPLVLEHWIITNRVTTATTQANNHHHPSASVARTLFANNSPGQSPKSHHHHQMAPNYQRSPATQQQLHNNLTTSTQSNGVSSNSHYSGNRARSTTLGTAPPLASIRTRTRLNSIDDCSSTAAATAVDEKLLVVAGNMISDNFHDVKSSASCFSLSAAQQQSADHQTATTINTSPSIGSLANVQTPTGASPSNTNNLSQSPRTSAMSSIYTIYNRMSLLLKTLMTTTHIVPAHWIASKAQQTDSCVFSYRIYTHPSSTQENTKTKASLEEIVPSANSQSPNKRLTPLNLSFTSLNIKDLVPFDELDQFCPILKLGSIKSEFSELDVSFCYRTDMKNSTHFMKSPRLNDTYNKVFDDDCITAAKQLLACNDPCNPVNGHDQVASSDNDRSDALNVINQPLQPAFATVRKLDATNQDPSLSIIESAFDGILDINTNTNESDATHLNSNEVKKLDKLCSSANQKLQSEPIQVPKERSHNKSAVIGQNIISPGSTPKSLTDSFVFVDLNPPFASEESSDISTFFNGPSPAFSSGFESPKDVEELTNQLANIESNASQFDEFVDNICLSEGELDED